MITSLVSRVMPRADIMIKKSGTIKYCIYCLNREAVLNQLTCYRQKWEEAIKKKIRVLESGMPLNYQVLK